MDVAPVVVEDRLLVRARQALARAGVEPECLRDPVGAVLGLAVDVDPEELPPVQPARPVVQVVESLYLISVKQDCFAHRSDPSFDRSLGGRTPSEN